MTSSDGKYFLNSLSKFLDSNNSNENYQQSQNSNGKQNLVFLPENMTILFAEDSKAQMAAKMMFYLVHSHGDNLREVGLNIYKWRV